MTREEFLLRFSLRTPVPFQGRGPYLARDAERGIYVQVHLLERSDPGSEGLLSALAQRMPHSEVLLFDLNDAAAVVTPNEAAFASLEAWLAAPAETGPIRIKFHPPPSKSQAAPPEPPPPAPPPAPAEGPGEFTQLFGSSPLKKPQPPRKVPPAPEPPTSPQPSDAEESALFTQLFGKSEGPTRSPPDRVEQTPLKPSFDSNPPPLEAEPVEPPPPPPQPSEDSGGFTRFFGTREEGKASPDLPPPRFGSASSAFSPEPERPTPEPPSGDQTSEPADAGAFTQIVSGRRGRAPKEPVEPATPSEPAEDPVDEGTAPKSKPRSIVPLVLVLGVALIATLILILVLVLLK
jgi:hypothetical protein